MNVEYKLPKEIMPPLGQSGPCTGTILPVSSRPEAGAAEKTSPSQDQKLS
jgi:hypothetical protein